MNPIGFTSQRRSPYQYTRLPTSSGDANRYTNSNFISSFPNIMNCTRHCSNIAASIESEASSSHENSPHTPTNNKICKSSVSIPTRNKTPYKTSDDSFVSSNEPVVKWGLESSHSDSVIIYNEPYIDNSSLPSCNSYTNPSPITPASTSDTFNQLTSYINGAEDDDNRPSLTARNNSFVSQSVIHMDCQDNQESDIEVSPPKQHVINVNQCSDFHDCLDQSKSNGCCSSLWFHHTDRGNSCRTIFCLNFSIRRCFNGILRWITHRQVFKCFLAWLYLAFVMLIISHLLVFVHMRSPLTKICGHLPDRLPDIILDNVQRQAWGFAVAEIMITSLSSTTFLLIIFHQNRYVVLRRLFCILASIFSIRAFCIVSTSLTYSSSHLYELCPPLHVISLTDFIKKALKIYAGFGLRIHGGATCGDYIYSGHTCTLTVFNLIILMYSPTRRIFLPLKILSCLTNAFGVICILLAHEHYTVDIVLAVAISILVFNEYHNIAHNPDLRQWDSWRLIITAPVTYFMERDGEGKVTNRLRLSFLEGCVSYKRHRYHLAQPQYRKNSTILQ